MIGLAESLTAAGVASLCGVLIGMMGVGGVILVPSLLMWPSITATTAISCSMAAYLTAAAMGTYAFWRQGHIVWPATAYVCAGAAPGAFVGAMVTRYTSDFVLKVIVVAFLTASTLYSIAKLWCDRRKQQSNSATSNNSSTQTGCELHVLPTAHSLPSTGSGDVVAGAGVGDASAGAGAAASTTGGAAAVTPLPSTTDGKLVFPVFPRYSRQWWHQIMGWTLALGFIDGLGSAITGTSGPVILLPLVFMQGGWNVREAVGCSQVVQIPISLAATAGNLVFNFGAFDWLLLVCLAAPLPVGVAAGAALSKRLPAEKLKGLALGALLITAIVMTVKLVCGDGGVCS